MVLKRVAEAPSYREMSIAVGAERQQYGTDAGRQGSGSAPQQRFTAHEREAHLSHQTSNAAIGESALEELVAHLRTNEGLANRIGTSPRHGARDAPHLSDEERRIVAGMRSGRHEKVAEVARKLKETAVDFPALAGLPPMTSDVLEALNKFGKGGGGRGGGRAGGIGPTAGGGPGYGFDPSYLPQSRLGSAGFTVGGRSVTGGGPGDGQGGGRGGFADGFMGSPYFPAGRGNAMDPKSPTGGARGGRTSSGGPGGSGAGTIDMFGSYAGGVGIGLPTSRADALFRARTWKAFNPGGGVMDDPKPDDPPPPPRKPDPKNPPPITKDPSADPVWQAKTAYANKTRPEPRQLTEEEKKALAEEQARNAHDWAVVGYLVAGALLGGAVGALAGSAVGATGMGAFLGAGIGALGTAFYHEDIDPRSAHKHRPADDGTGPAGPRSARNRINYRPSDDGGPVGPRLQQGRAQGSRFRPADDGGPVGPRLAGTRHGFGATPLAATRSADGARWSSYFKPNPEDPRPGGPQ